MKSCIFCLNVLWYDSINKDNQKEWINLGFKYCLSGGGDSDTDRTFFIFSSAETAMTTVNKIRIQSLAEQGNKRAVILEKIISNSPKMLSTVLIGNNIVNMSVSSLMTTLTIKILGNAYVGITTGILTLLILIFGEITPKTWQQFMLKNCPWPIQE